MTNTNSKSRWNLPRFLKSASTNCDPIYMGTDLLITGTVKHKLDNSSLKQKYCSFPIVFIALCNVSAADCWSTVLQLQWQRSSFSSYSLITSQICGPVICNRKHQLDSEYHIRFSLSTLKEKQCWQQCLRDHVWCTRTLIIMVITMSSWLNWQLCKVYYNGR